MKKEPTAKAIQLRAVNAYLLECIEVEGNENPTDKEKLKYLFSEFDREANYPNNKKRLPNLQERLKDWLMNLPSCIHLPWQNYYIIEKGKELNYLTDSSSEAKKNKFLYSFHSVAAAKLIHMAEKAGINPFKYI